MGGVGVPGDAIVDAFQARGSTGILPRAASIHNSLYRQTRRDKCADISVITRHTQRASPDHSSIREARIFSSRLGSRRTWIVFPPVTKTSPGFAPLGLRTFLIGAT